MSAGQLAICDHRAHLVRQCKQTQGIGHRRTGFDHAPRDLLLRQAETLHQQLIAFRLFDRVQVLTLQVLDQRQLHDLALVRFQHHCRDFL